MDVLRPVRDEPPGANEGDAPTDGGDNGPDFPPSGGMVSADASSTAAEAPPKRAKKSASISTTATPTEELIAFVWGDPPTLPTSATETAGEMPGNDGELSEEQLKPKRQLQVTRPEALDSRHEIDRRSPEKTDVRERRHFKSALRLAEKASDDRAR